MWQRMCVKALEPIRGVKWGTQSTRNSEKRKKKNLSLPTLNPLTHESIHAKRFNDQLKQCHELHRQPRRKMRREFDALINVVVFQIAFLFSTLCNVFVPTTSQAHKASTPGVCKYAATSQILECICIVGFCAMQYPYGGIATRTSRLLSTTNIQLRDIE